MVRRAPGSSHPAGPRPRPATPRPRRRRVGVDHGGAAGRRDLHPSRYGLLFRRPYSSHAPGDPTMTGSGIIDAHAHVFRPAATYPRGVDQLAPADRDAPVEDLLELMAGSGVDAAVLIPLDAHDDYVARVLAEYPKTFAAIAVAEPAELQAGGARGVESLRARRDRFGFHGLRTQ